MQPSQSRLRRVLRWVPSGVLAAGLSSLWALFLADDGLPGVAAWIGLFTLAPFAGLLALLGTGIHAGIRRRFDAPIAAMLLLSLVALWPGAWSFGLLQLAYPVSAESRQPGATVRLPADGPLRVFWGGEKIETNYHAFTSDQHWAYDLVIEPAAGGSANLEDYGCWGREVVAPADARVHVAKDGAPDATPGMLTENSTNPLGNHVALELPSGTFLLLAHLQKGSVRVKAGETVSEGQVIGRCGNSGNTSEPHIHLHHQRQDPAKFPVGFAEGLPLTFRDHDGPAMPTGGFRMDGDKPVLTGAVVRHVRAK